MASLFIGRSLQPIHDFVVDHAIDMVVPGPEAPLVDGVWNYLRRMRSSSHIPVIGPSLQGAKLEGSKSFAKALMKRKGVPTASHIIFHRDEYHKAREFLEKSAYPIVIKVDGLAAGKGVTISQHFNHALQTLDEIFLHNKFGVSGNSIVLEEYLDGEEVSVFVVTDGKDYVLLSPAQDYKRVGDGDTGKNTGGMGSYSFNEILSDGQIDEIKHSIIDPVLDGLLEESSPYTGCLYCGLIITREGIKVIEFNCRFGDPETQVVLQNLENDLLELMYLTVKGELKNYSTKNSGKAICLVLASFGYPDSYETGYEITGLDLVEHLNDTIIYHAGTSKVGGKIVSSGGRVLNVVLSSKEKDFKELINNVYQTAELINFENKYYRKDIGLRGLLKLN